MNDQLREYESAVQALAYQAGHEHGLRDTDFAVRLIPPKRLGGQGWLIKWGQIYRLYWSIGLSDVDKFESSMRSAVKAIAWMKTHRKTDLVMWDGLKKPPIDDVPNAYRSLYDMPPILDHTEVEYEIFYKVKMKHKMTGVVIEVEHAVTKGVNKLVTRARENLTELVTDVVKQLTERVKPNEAFSAQYKNDPNFIEPHPLDSGDSYITTDGERVS